MQFWRRSQFALEIRAHIIFGLAVSLVASATEDDVQLGMGPECAGSRCEVPGKKLVIGVEQSNQFAARCKHPCVASTSGTLFAIVAQNAYGPIIVCFGKRFDSSIHRPIVDHDDLELVCALGEDRINRSVDDMATVECWNDNRKLHRV